MLNPEQKIAVLDYIISLTEGTSQLLPERYELMKENQTLKQKIEILEKQLSGVHFENTIKSSSAKIDYGYKGNDMVINVMKK